MSMKGKLFMPVSVSPNLMKSPRVDVSSAIG
jgi:hypothetical protein